MRRPLLVLGLIALYVIVGLACGGGGNRSASPQPAVRRVESTATEKPIRVLVSDVESNLGHKPVIWFRGMGDWHLTGMDSRDIGTRPIGVVDHLFFYPDGRDGQEIKIPVATTSQMRDTTNVRGALHITVEPDHIEVIGEPLKAATGKIKMIIPRNR